MKIKSKFLLFILVFSLIFISLASESYGAGLPNTSLKYMQRGSAVKDLQIALNKVGFKLVEDGIYGPGTRSAVLNFQRKYSNLVKDGIYGPKTRIVLEKALKGEKPILNDASNTKEKIAYLTFDDGPSKTVTPEILKVLDEYNIKATFFILGTMAEKNPAIVKSINSKGHSIGHHSYSHNYKYIYANLDNFLGEVNKTEKIFKNILGNDFSTQLLRFPGGSFEKYKKPYKDALIKKGYKIYDWNSLNGDTESKNPSAENLISRLKETSKGKKNLIVLMHDSNGKENTAKSLPPIIDYLKTQGYTFKVLAQ